MRWTRAASLVLALASAASHAGEPEDRTLWSEIAGPRRERAAKLVSQAAEYLDAFPREAALLLEEAVGLDPTRADAFHLLGVSRFRERDFAGCADALEAAWRLAPDHEPPARRAGATLPAVADLLGLCLAVSGRHDAAIAHYRRLLLEPSGNVALDTLHGNLADCYLALGRIDDAVAEYQQAISLAPRRAIYHFGMAVAHDRDERATRAAAAMRRALELDPNLSELGSPNTYFVPAEDEHYYRGLAHQVAAETDPPRRLIAIAQFRRYLAVASGPWNARAAEHLAELGPPVVTARDVSVHPHGPDADALARRFAAAAPGLQRCLEGMPHVAARVVLAWVAPAGGARRAPGRPAVSISSQGAEPLPAEASACLEKQLVSQRVAVDKLTRLTAVLVSR